MRLALIALSLTASVAPTATAFQGGARGSAAKPATGACSLLTKDLIAAHTPASKESLKLMFSIPPEEEKAGGGTMCSYGDVILQVEPFPAASFEKLFGQWTPVPGVGDRAYFRDNRGMFAELGVLAGGRTLTIQMDAPTGRTPASIQSNVIALAKALLAKWK
jgi:hypothetical protein